MASQFWSLLRTQTFTRPSIALGPYGVRLDRCSLRLTIQRAPEFSYLGAINVSQLRGEWSRSAQVEASQNTLLNQETRSVRQCYEEVTFFASSTPGPLSRLQFRCRNGDLIS